VPPRTTRMKLIISQLFCAALLLSLALSFYVDPLAPAFSTGDDDGSPRLLAPSLFRFLWERPDAARRVLRTGFTHIGYFEELRKDYEIPGIPMQVLGWFIGFLPRHAGDILLSLLPKMPYPGQEASASSEQLEANWRVTSVLFSLPPGQDVQAASFVSASSPLVGVYHTHATESYLSEISKTGAEQAFTSDPLKSVVRVGEMLVSELQGKYRIPCLHSRTIHDSDSRLGAYYRSEATVKAIQSKYPDCKILIDIHRDSQPYSLTGVTIRGKRYARLMIVIGTDNPQWVSNYGFARRIVEKLEEGYPGISRGIFYASAVYNQKYSPQAILIEVGGVDNTFAECQNSMEALAWALASVILPVPPSKP